MEPIIKIVELDGDDLVKDYSDEIERMLGSKMKSVKVRKKKKKKRSLNVLTAVGLYLLYLLSSCLPCCVEVSGVGGGRRPVPRVQRYLRGESPLC